MRSIASRLLASSVMSLALALSLGCTGASDGDSASAGSPFPRLPVPDARVVDATPTPSPSPTATPLPASPPVRFVAIGDTGTATSSQFKVAAAIDAKCIADGCDFGVLLGDNFYQSGVSSATDSQFDTKFQAPYGDLGFPFYIVLGNHDYGSEGYGDQFHRGAYQVEYSKTHDNFRLPAAHHAFEVGAASFLVTDTNLLVWNHDDAVDVQGAYFRDVLAASDRPWKIAMTHHPVYSNGKHGNAGVYDGKEPGTRGAGVHLKRFLDESLCGEVDLYLSGHDHNLQLLPGTQECPGTFIVSGAGASVTSLLGTNPAEFQKNVLGFTYVVVTDDAITIEFVDANGVVLYTTEKTK